LVIWAFTVETRYNPMEEIAKHFDGPDAVDIDEVAVAGAKESGIELNAAEIKPVPSAVIHEVK
ncbi:hypothetical protein SEUCBS139899_008341, partial [Sporothrix eucalyptigena]